MSSRKSQRLSRDIQRSYIVIIIFFTLTSIAVILTNWKHLKDNAKREVDLVVDFMEGEFMEDEVQSTQDLFVDAKEELPDISGVDFRVRRGGEEYVTGKIPDIDIEYRDRIIPYDNYDYYIYNYSLPVYEGEPAEITVVRNMRREKRYLGQQMRIFFIAFSLINLFIYMVYRHLFRRLIPQLEAMEGVTDSINLDSMDLKIIKDDYYEEFGNILLSYERMLKRLEDQKSSHINFIHNASHELKTPIFVIKGYADILKKWGGDMDEVGQEAIDVIGNEVRSMQGLTEKLLFLAKGSEIDRRDERVAIDEMVKEVIVELGYIYRNQRIEYLGGDEVVTTDRELLKIMLKNIVENACKYGEERDVEITSILKEEEVWISVRDSGIGMSPEDLDKIYTEFYRGDRSRNREIEGHGLGMAIVGSIEKMLGARIEIESEQGKGTTVNIGLKVN